MGKYVAGNEIYVLAEVLSVNADDNTKYKVQTNSARFYVSESKDTLVTDPEQDIVTTTELYNVLVNIAKMDSTTFKYLFTIYNNTYGTEYNFANLTEVLASGMTYETLLEIYDFYMSTIDVKVGDIVRVLLSDDTDSKYCGVLHIDGGGETPVIYTLYDADKDKVYSLTRQQAQILKWTVNDKSSAPIETLLKKIKDNISDITGDIDRSSDDPGEGG